MFYENWENLFHIKYEINHTFYQIDNEIHEDNCSKLNAWKYNFCSKVVSLVVTYFFFSKKNCLASLPEAARSQKICSFQCFSKFYSNIILLTQVLKSLTSSGSWDPSRQLWMGRPKLVSVSDLPGLWLNELCFNSVNQITLKLVWAKSRGVSSFLKWGGK